MGNLFDSLRDSAFDVTLATFGYDASWTPSNAPSTPITARVHFKDPNDKHDAGGMEYMPLSPFIEYRFPSFLGLYELVRANNGREYITIDGNTYEVSTVDRQADGKTYKAMLKLLDD